MANLIRRPTVEEKLDILAASARYDVCLATCSGNVSGGVGRVRDPVHPASRWIYPAHIPGKGEVGILKVLQTNACKNHCSYCFLSSRCDGQRRMGFAPQELADLLMGFVRARLAHGIFISSGVGHNPDASMERMVETAEILRRRYRFGGYIHLKLLPGCTSAAIERAAMVADRISINLETPSATHLRAIASEKDFERELLEPMRIAGQLVQRRMKEGDRRGFGGLRAKSHTTQFVVGASDESDLDILRLVDQLYRQLYLFRSYFSAYQRPEDGLLRSQPEQAVPPGLGDHSLQREHRLYQCDFLLRGYGFRLPDLVFDCAGQLPVNVDPKTAHAMMHPEIFPVEVNRATEELLLRVPGIGPVAARRIVEQRRTEPFRSLEDLKRSGAVVHRAEDYVEFSGRRAAGSGKRAVQRWLFEEMNAEGWQTGIAPSGAMNTAKSTGCGREAGGTPWTSDARYEYPGQRGKPLYYGKGKEPNRLVCR